MEELRRCSNYHSKCRIRSFPCAFKPRARALLLLQFLLALLPLLQPSNAAATTIRYNSPEPSEVTMLSRRDYKNNGVRLLEAASLLLDGLLAAVDGRPAPVLPLLFTTGAAVCGRDVGGIAAPLKPTGRCSCCRPSAPSDGKPTPVHPAAAPAAAAPSPGTAAATVALPGAALAAEWMRKLLLTRSDTIRPSAPGPRSSPAQQPTGINPAMPQSPAAAAAEQLLPGTSRPALCADICRSWAASKPRPLGPKPAPLLPTAPWVLPGQLCLAELPQPPASAAAVWCGLQLLLALALAAVAGRN